MMKKHLNVGLQWMDIWTQRLIEEDFYPKSSDHEGLDIYKLDKKRVVCFILCVWKGKFKHMQIIYFERRLT